MIGYYNSDICRRSQEKSVTLKPYKETEYRHSLGDGSVKKKKKTLGTVLKNVYFLEFKYKCLFVFVVFCLYFTSIHHNPKDIVPPVLNSIILLSVFIHGCVFFFDRFLFLAHNPNEIVLTVLNSFMLCRYSNMSRFFFSTCFASIAHNPSDIVLVVKVITRAVLFQCITVYS